MVMNLTPTWTCSPSKHFGYDSPRTNLSFLRRTQKICEDSAMVARRHWLQEDSAYKRCSNIQKVVLRRGPDLKSFFLKNYFCKFFWEHLRVAQCFHDNDFVMQVVLDFILMVQLLQGCYRYFENLLQTVFKSLLTQVNQSKIKPSN